ncbi:hypothetical protein GCM10027605_12320 [Micromonospora zhanjiangensis]
MEIAGGEQAPRHADDPAAASRGTSIRGMLFAVSEKQLPPAPSAAETRQRDQLLPRAVRPVQRAELVGQVGGVVADPRALSLGLAGDRRRGLR